MKSFESKTISFFSRPWPPLAVLFISLGLTAAVTFYDWRVFEEKDRSRFENSVLAAQDTINDHLATYVALLRGTAGLYAGNTELTKDDFHSYINQLGMEQHFPGSQGIGMLLRYQSSELPQAQQRLKTDQGSLFHVWPGGKREEYFPVMLIEPLERRNARALGFDMFSEPLRRETMERARDTGEAAASAKTTLVQEIDREKQAGFLIFFPLYDQSLLSPEPTVEERRRAIRGFVYSPFRGDDLMRDIFRDNPNTGLDFVIYDGASMDPRSVVHDSFSADKGRRAYRPHFVSEPKQQQVAGRTWTIQYRSRPEFDFTSARGKLPYIFIGGLLMSLVLFAIVRSETISRTRAERTTEHLRRTQEAVRAAEERLRTVLDSVRDYAIFMIDRQGIITSWNSGAQAVLGYSESEIVGRNFSVLYDPSDCESRIPEKEVEKAALAGRAEDERWHLRKDGSRFWAAGAMRPAFDENGGIAGFVKVMRDITERRGLEEKLREQNRVKDDFLATLSHELRTPLTPMLGWVRILRDKREDPAMTKRGLEVIERNIRSQAQLIDDLLDVSRIITGKLKLNVRAVHFTKVVEAAVDTILTAADAKELAIRRHYTTSDDLITADPDRLQQVVWNLLANAVKFTPRSGTITIHLAREQSSIGLAIEDSGAGIPADFLPYVFDRFRQLDSTTTRKFGGLGLGLSIVRNLVEMHGGTVWVQSEGEEKGAKFFVRLPVRAITASPLTAPAGDSGRTSAVYGGGRLDGLKLLVVDDQLDALELVALVLQQRGATVDAVASANEALQHMKSQQYDVILSDIGMPGEDGYWLIRQIRASADERTAQTPSIALTAFARHADRTRALAEGFNAHVSKPVDPDSLVAQIIDLMDRSKTPQNA